MDDPFINNATIPFLWNPIMATSTTNVASSNVGGMANMNDTLFLHDQNQNNHQHPEHQDHLNEDVGVETFWKDLYSKNNLQLGMGWKIPQYYSLPYQVIGTIFQGIIFIVGVLGNVMVVIVVLRSRSMRTPTNCYLVSLAVADTMVLLASVPNEIIAYYLLGDKWIWGPIGCALFIFLQYLGINASSLSIAAFTVERYIAICHPMLAHKLCTVRRAKRIILYVWMFATAYCAPWLFLTKTEPIHYLWVETEVYTCKFKLNREHYKGYFLTDIVLFYLLPLMISCVLYALIARILYNSNDILHHHKPKNFQQHPHHSQHHSNVSSSAIVVSTSTHNSTPSHTTNNKHDNNKNFGSTSQTTTKTNSEKVRSCDSKKTTSTSDSSRVQVVKMLAVVVAVFATLWLPYRALVVYNSFTFPPYMELWYLMFAKTMIFVNSAINPIIYSACSMKFRREFKRMLTCKTKRYSAANKTTGPYRNAAAYRMDGVTISLANTTTNAGSANSGLDQLQQSRSNKSFSQTGLRSGGKGFNQQDSFSSLARIEKTETEQRKFTQNDDNAKENLDEVNLLNNNSTTTSPTAAMVKTTASITVYHHGDHERSGGGSVMGRTETIISSDSMNSCQEHQF